jgi:IclR family transcriptional regulator, KDG regulon repressor
VETLNKALDIIETFAANTNKELGLSELCDLTGMKKGTAHRILTTLLKRGYVIQKKKRGKYSIKHTFININLEDNYHNVIRRISESFMIKLGNKINENLILAVQDGYEVKTIMTTETKNVLTASTEIGVKAPMYCTAIGRIFLAYLPENEVDTYLKDMELRSRPSNKIIDLSHLKISLKMTKEEGVAYDDEETYFGVRSVSVPVRGSEGDVIAALGVIGPSIRLTREKISLFLPELKSCATDISETIISAK